MDLKKKITSLAAVVVISGAIGYYLGHMNQKVVTKTQTDVVIEERIVEIPGKGRVITRVIRDKSSSERTETSLKKKWILF